MSSTPPNHAAAAASATSDEPQKISDDLLLEQAVNSLKGLSTTDRSPDISQALAILAKLHDSINTIVNYYRSIFSHPWSELSNLVAALRLFTRLAETNKESYEQTLLAWKSIEYQKSDTFQNALRKIFTPSPRGEQDIEHSLAAGYYASIYHLVATEAPKQALDYINKCLARDASNPELYPMLLLWKVRLSPETRTAEKLSELAHLIYGTTSTDNSVKSQLIRDFEATYLEFFAFVSTELHVSIHEHMLMKDNPTIDKRACLFKLAAWYSTISNESPHEHRKTHYLQKAARARYRLWKLDQHDTENLRCASQHSGEALFKTTELNFDPHTSFPIFAQAITMFARAYDDNNEEIQSKPAKLENMLVAYGAAVIKIFPDCDSLEANGLMAYLVPCLEEILYQGIALPLAQSRFVQLQQYLSKDPYFLLHQKLSTGSVSRSATAGTNIFQNFAQAPTEQLRASVDFIQLVAEVKYYNLGFTVSSTYSNVLKSYHRMIASGNQKAVRALRDFYQEHNQIGRFLLLGMICKDNVIDAFHFLHCFASSRYSPELIRIARFYTFLLDKNYIRLGLDFIPTLLTCLGNKDLSANLPQFLQKKFDTLLSRITNSLTSLAKDLELRNIADFAVDLSAPRAAARLASSMSAVTNPLGKPPCVSTNYSKEQKNFAATPIGDVELSKLNL